ncbi:hypothetical protein [Rhodovulum visakhapatnamense]|uniref:Uncharacterized protein n=1 Tax=Rhodovulum visakhapatnamense TaxID=364297 RepID=A0A4R8FT07_9RHOB|nr:hypothetical protein [Rhodovulum visakhapatnamense]TDX25561.1 hypothetical protein EV657_11958 [Rhodovulum visakhapatnamense]
MTRNPERPEAEPARPDPARFDSDLARLLARPEDEDTAELSRAVLSRLAEPPARGPGAGEVLSEPLPWAAGFGGLLLAAAALGYALLPGASGEELILWALLGDLSAGIGGF